MTLYYVIVIYVSWCSCRPPPPLGVTASYLSRLISFRQKKLFTLLRLYIELSSGFNINKTWAKTNSIHWLVERKENPFGFIHNKTWTEKHHRTNAFSNERIRWLLVKVFVDYVLTFRKFLLKTQDQLIFLGTDDLRSSYLIMHAAISQALWKV